MEQMLALMKAKYGPEHPDTLAAMNNLATTYQAVDRTADAHRAPGAGRSRC